MLASDTVHIQKLCDTIRAYWNERGFPSIEAWPETVIEAIKRNATAMVVVRSNIGPNGYPPKVSK